MRISYPEAERMGWNYEDVYLFAFSELDYLTTELQKLYNNDGINDIPSYVLRLVKKMLETWGSIFLIYSHNRDYVSACTLCRNIIDNLATIYHVYMNSNEDEKVFKHYLYVLDGILCRYKDYPDYNQIVNNGRIKEDEFIALVTQVRDTNKSDMIAKEFIIKELKRSPLYNNNKIVNQIIENANWKYKSLKPLLNPKEKNQFTWNSLYKMVDSNPSFSTYASYLSVFVHGLSISNCDLDKSEELFEPILSLSIVNLNSTLVAIKEIYKNEIKRYNIDFKKSSTAKTLLCSVSDEYLQGLIEQCQKEHLK